ncbi:MULTISPECIES: hypothetical protein [unclassified Mesorhizobium]|nr:MULTISPECIES: hypothetical protein [unclassified Mesorhizobium]
MISMVDEAHLDELRQLRLVRALAVGIQENRLEAIRLRELTKESLRALAA